MLRSNARMNPVTSPHQRTHERLTHVHIELIALFVRPNFTSFPHLEQLNIHCVGNLLWFGTYSFFSYTEFFHASIPGVYIFVMFYGWLFENNIRPHEIWIIICCLFTIFTVFVCCSHIICVMHLYVVSIYVVNFLCVYSYSVLFI